MGGLIIVGVNDNGKINGYIVGLNDKKDLEKSINGQVMNYCEIIVDIRLEWFPIDNKILLLIHVPFYRYF
jgi:predicted HTH transcriptional regulator